MLDWIAEYLEHPERYPVLSTVRPGDIRRVAARVAAGGSANRCDTILDDFESKIIPGITHWNHPAFFGYFATSSSVPGILAEMLDRDARREGDAVEDVARRDGARAGRDRLAASDARPERRLVRHHDRHRVDLVDARARRGARGAAGAADSRARHGRTHRSAASARLLLVARAFVGRQGARSRSGSGSRTS